MRRNEIYLATGVDRIWHWVHAAGIVVLALTGFNIHFSQTFNVFGSFETAVKAHNLTGIIVSFDWGLWFLYNLLSLRFRFYLPGRDDLPAGMFRQAMYYCLGIFKGAPHPFAISERRKFNPLQKWTYLGVMAVLVPFQIATGLYLYFMVTDFGMFKAKNALFFSVAHNAGAFLAVMFVLGHIYLATTGRTPGSYFKFMITGWHEHEEH